MLNRRDILSLFAALAAAGLPLGGLMGSARAAPRDARKHLAEITGGIKPKKGRITITLPKVTDQGDFVPLRVAVESPMSEVDHVKAIHIVAERNPTPAVASFYLSRAIGKAEVSTRIRLVKTQVVVAVAEMSDGSLFLGKARCKISTGAGGCG
ncbi:MAG: thiosulfate oxidation carrier protein SoxY [Proteobacteria bacterium]|nr:thiosulfate oxidation carrier protein SoxY [Pseudomonadota bacterium]